MHTLRNPSPALAPLVPESARQASIAVIDLRTTMPWDAETVVESVKRTGRLVVVHEAAKSGGLGADIAAEVVDRCFLHLEAPVKRVTGCVRPSSVECSV